MRSGNAGLELPIARGSAVWSYQPLRVPDPPDISAYIYAPERRALCQPGRVPLAGPFLVRTAKPSPASVEGRMARELRRIGKRIASGWRPSQAAAALVTFVQAPCCICVMYTLVVFQFIGEVEEQAVMHRRIFLLAARPSRQRRARTSRFARMAA